MQAVYVWCAWIKYILYFDDSLTHLAFIHSFIYSFIHSFIHSFVHSLTQFPLFFYLSSYNLSKPFNFTFVLFSILPPFLLPLPNAHPRFTFVFSSDMPVWLQSMKRPSKRNYIAYCPPSLTFPHNFSFCLPRQINQIPHPPSLFFAFSNTKTLFRENPSV